MHRFKWHPRIFLACIITIIFTAGSFIAAKVPKPWSPIQTQSDGKGHIVVRVWNREYIFDRSPLPVSITSGGAELLAAPVRLVGRIDPAQWAKLAAGTGEPVWGWDQQGVAIMEQSKEGIILSGYLANLAVTVNATVRIDYDGFMRMDLAVIPNQPIMNNLWFEVPMKPERATLRHTWPGPVSGSVANSAVVPKEGMRLTFQPILWVGNEDGGISLCCESDEQWLPADKKDALEIMPEGPTTVMRAHLLDTPTTTGIRIFSFGLQATPVKPWSNALHERNQFFSGYSGHAAFVGGVYDFKEDYLDRLAAKGVKTFYVWNEWSTAFGHWRAAAEDEPKLRKFVKACHRRGMKVVPYFGQYLSTQSPEFVKFAKRTAYDISTSTCGQLWNVQSTPQYILFFNLNDPEWRETYLKGVVSAVDRYGFDGVYLDGQLFPNGSTNHAAGCGYKDAEGVMRPTYPVFAGRDFFKRLYEKLHARGKIIDVHNSAYCGTFNLGFADSSWDGEQFGWGQNDPELKKDPLHAFPLESFRAEFMGRNFGVPCEFLEYDPAAVNTKLAITLLHDVRVRPSNDKILDIMAPIWAAMERFGTSKAEWHPYWKNAELIAADQEKVKVSFYRRVVFGSPRLLLVITNFANEPVTCRLTPRGRTLPHVHTARNALTGENLQIEADSLVIPLPASTFRLLEAR